MVLVWWRSQRILRIPSSIAGEARATLKGFAHGLIIKNCISLCLNEIACSLLMVFGTGRKIISSSLVALIAACLSISKVFSYFSSLFVKRKANTRTSLFSPFQFN